MREIFPDEISDLAGEYKLPALPAYDDGPGSAALVLFRMNDASVTLTCVSAGDAREYCNREDTHGSGWFVGFRLNENEEDE
jgi:hypothetical protein